MKVYTHLDWVKLAASRDPYYRTLEGVYATGEYMAATDRHRLHVANQAMLSPGLWHHKTGESIDGTFPNVRYVTPAAEPNLTVTDPEGMYAIVRAAVEAHKVQRYSSHRVSLPTCDGRYVHLEPSYVLDALVGSYTGTTGWGHVSILVQGPDQPIKFSMNGERTAVLMPVRLGHTDRSPRFDLSEFVQSAAATVAA